MSDIVDWITKCLGVLWSRITILPRLTQIDKAITTLEGKLGNLLAATVTMRKPSISVLHYLVKDLEPLSQIAVHAKRLETIDQCIPELEQLVHASRSVRAFCGSKGILAPKYYHTNHHCAVSEGTEITRIFSMRSLERDVENSKPGEVPSSVQALVDHEYLEREGFGIKPYLLLEVNLKLVERQAVQIPVGFGFAIACDRTHTPFGAVLHWEAHTEGLVYFAGVFVDNSDVLKSSMKLYDTLESFSTDNNVRQIVEDKFPHLRLRASNEVVELVKEAKR